MTCNVPGCRDQDRRVTTKCGGCRQEFTVSAGHHATGFTKEDYRCIRCRGAGR